MDSHLKEIMKSPSLMLSGDHVPPETELYWGALLNLATLPFNIKIFEIDSHQRMPFHVLRFNGQAFFLFSMCCHLFGILVQEKK